MTCPSGKRRMDSEHEARIELVGAIVKRNAGRCNRRECRFYQCPLCNGWHLTSRKEVVPA